MKKKALAQSHKKLARSQKKLKKAFKKLGKTGKQAGSAETPAWIAALAAMAGAITTALADRDKRRQLMDIAVEAKDKATGLLTGAKATKQEELEEFAEAHGKNGIVTPATEEEEEEFSGAV